MRNRWILWVLVLVITTVAATTASSDTDESLSQGLDPGGLSLTDTDAIRISEEKVFDHLESREERMKICAPTPKCIRAGGYCVRFRSECNGLVDPRSCKRERVPLARGGKRRRCKCCIPDITTDDSTTYRTLWPIYNMTREGKTTDMTTEDTTTYSTSWYFGSWSIPVKRQP
ncbi:unnamed protein product [Meganyctiphanes norvegica]|uniref:Uncharacterized protein n=1 Tax=Meganyctiphanes norvegica TaxID=48144 RepID=A0AAV2QEU4_MEGNR